LSLPVLSDSKLSRLPVAYLSGDIAYPACVHAATCDIANRTPTACLWNGGQYFNGKCLRIRNGQGNIQIQNTLFNSSFPKLNQLLVIQFKDLDRIVGGLVAFRRFNGAIGT